MHRPGKSVIIIPWEVGSSWYPNTIKAPFKVSVMVKEPNIRAGREQGEDKTIKNLLLLELFLELKQNSINWIPPSFADTSLLRTISYPYATHSVSKKNELRQA